MQGLEGRRAGRGLGELAGAHQTVEDEGHRGLSGAVCGGVGGGEEQFHAAPAEPLPQQRPEAGVFAQQGDGGGDRLGAAGQPQRPGGQGAGRARGVQGQRGGGDA
ncbi:hypothetical protein RKD26_000307 [Streptomyces calvus]